MTETQKPIHHSDVWDLPPVWQALRSETLLHSLAVSLSFIDAGCSTISPRGTHKSLCWTCPLWPFISVIKPSCCPPVLTQKTPCHQHPGSNCSSRRPLMAKKTATMTVDATQHNLNKYYIALIWLKMLVIFHALWKSTSKDLELASNK